MRGITDLVIEGEIIKAVPGNLYFINPDEVHAMFAHTESYYHCIVFKKEFLSFGENSVINTRLIAPLFSGKLCFPRVSQNEALLSIFDRADTLSLQGEKYAPFIAADMLKLLGVMEEAQLLSRSKEQPTEPIHRALDYMEQNFDKHLTLFDIAASAGMSPKYFCSYFKKHTLTTAVSYLNSLRIRKACRLLENKCSVTDAALSCGFDNISFFIKKFKEATGVTPGKYAK